MDLKIAGSCCIGHKGVAFTDALVLLLTHISSIKLAVARLKRVMAMTSTTSTNISTVDIVVHVAPFSSSVFCQTVSYPATQLWVILGEVVTPAMGLFLRGAGGGGEGEQD